MDMTPQNISPQVARALKNENVWATTPSPRLKAQLKEEKKARDRAVQDHLEEKRAGHAQAEKDTEARHEEGQKAVHVEAVPPKRQYLPPGNLTWIACDLPGYEGVRLGYNLSAAYDVWSREPKNDDDLGYVRRLAVLVGGWENKSLYDPLTEELAEMPTPGDFDSYVSTLSRRMQPLAIWALSKGYEKALDQLMGEGWRASQKP